MAAQRRKRKYRKEARKITFKKLKKFLVVFFLVLVPVAYIVLTTRHWDGKTRFSMVINSKDGAVSVVTFNPDSDEITSILIPANTQINLSRQLGVWKIGSVWQLGINEGMGGALLAESVTRHFKFPVYLWADSHALAFVENNPVAMLGAVLRPYDANFGLGDRFNVALFAMRVKNTKRVAINLGETAYLKKTKLIDGEEGYVRTGSIPQNLAVIFSDSEISRKNFKILIADASGKTGLAEEVGELIEVIGGKVASVAKQDIGDFDCEILINKETKAEIFSKFLNCDISKKSSDGTFDIELKIGSQFADRY